MFYVVHVKFPGCKALEEKPLYLKNPELARSLGTHNYLVFGSP